MIKKIGKKEENEMAVFTKQSKSNTAFIVSKEKSLEFKKQFESKVANEEFKKRCMEISSFISRSNLKK